MHDVYTAGIQPIASLQRGAHAHTPHLRMPVAQAEYDRIAAALRARDAGVNMRAALYNWTIGWVAPNMEYSHTAPPLNLPRILAQVTTMQHTVQHLYVLCSTYIRRSWLRHSTLCTCAQAVLQPMTGTLACSPWPCHSHERAHAWSPAFTQLLRCFHQVWSVHAYELLMCGCFNGDPHPGNILMLPDGRLGLIDYGQVCVYIHSYLLERLNIYISYFI